jgi:hypothetical protein
MSKKTKIWTSELWAFPDYLKWISFDVSPRGAEMSQKFRRGEFIEPELFPSVIYPNHAGVKPFDFGLVQDGLVLASERMADFLRGFELGNNQLIEVDLYDHTKEVKQPDHYFILNVTEKKEGCFIRERSKGRFSGNETDGFTTSSSAYGGIAVRESAVLGGVDLWMDPILARTPFFSGALGEAIKNGKFGRTGLKPCLVLP